MPGLYHLTPSHSTAPPLPQSSFAVLGIRTVHTSITRWHNCPGGLFSWNQACQNWSILGWGPWSDSSLEAQVQVRNSMKEDPWVDPRRRSIWRQEPWPQICVQLRSFYPGCCPKKTVEQSSFNGKVNGSVCALTFTLQCIFYTYPQLWRNQGCAEENIY